MQHEQHAFLEPTVVDAGQQYARLGHALELARQIASGGGAAMDLALDQSARVSSAYNLASPVAQRRFDTLMAEVSAWAGTGLDALAMQDDPQQKPRAAAARLAGELDIALTRLGRVLRI